MSEDFDRLQRDASAGDENAIDGLIARFLPRLHAYVRVHMGPGLRRHEASIDVVQSVCRELLEERERFEFRGEGALLGWLLNAALNKLRQRARFFARDKRDARRQVELPDGAVYDGLSPSREVMGQEEIERLEAALLQLPEDYREILVLARIVRMPHADIAEHLGRTVAAVRSVLGRAVTRLGMILERDDSADGQLPE
ncbi:MAG: sigma-70 family RNA polymerase sigma factor [Planctomycetes bacterium]|nr:sigma-70 family RNA polymerase sigma factor [Planctomycetota bacterium]